MLEVDPQRMIDDERSPARLRIIFRVRFLVIATWLPERGTLTLWQAGGAAAPTKTHSDFIQTLFGQGNAEDGICMLIVFLLVDRGCICETTAYRQGLLGGTIKSVNSITKSFLTVPAPSIG